ncbi:MULTISPECIES: lasso RiPP family leader peptide-containing protein [Saccharopolyspora]|uniref:Lasso RiPP family leader peptide-containing protein n=1 Tax=Saccharopolyspora cebuensis TaxID=418759 RepID=A0ABV4CFX3_9PSEU
MTDTYAAPELTEVGEFAADTLGLGGVLYDATARHSY